MKSFPIYQRLFVCFESQSGRWLPHNLSGWDYRQIVAGSVMGRGIYSILQVSPTVRSDCAGNFGLWVWEGIYCPTPMSYTQSDLSLAQPLDYTGICKFVFMYIRVNVRGCAGTIEGFLQFPLPNFPRMAWVEPR